MEFVGNLHKMQTENNTPVQYYLNLNGDRLFLNNYLNKRIEIEYTGEINCVKCGRVTKKSFAQGFCYPCFISAPETEECVLRPELCKAHEGVARDMEYAKTHCLTDQFVYLSLTSNIKVGVTRNTQIPTRWIDQGAQQAVILAKTPNRYLAGKMEVALKEKLNDKTNWRNMLTGKITDTRSLKEVKNQIIEEIDSEFEEFIEWGNDIHSFEYPVLQIPQKVVSLNLDKTNKIGGVLTGIKGQYLMFDGRSVINIRKYGGYKVKIKV